VVTKWAIEKPMIFKGDVAQAHGGKTVTLYASYCKPQSLK
jgi:hypothetical protein